jgi:D-sedoheptulose 7-phosphate isomerase
MKGSPETFALQIEAELEEGIQVKQQTIHKHLSTLSDILQLLIQTLRAGNKVILFGNGGSAADSQHIAAELVGRFKRERRALPAIALTTDTSILTAIANDLSFDNVFARQIDALGSKGDVALGFSTSGNSPNVLKALQQARELGLRTVGFTGADGGRLKQYVDICFRVPSRSTPRIQEVHIAVGHALCELIEREFCRDES